LQSAATDVEKMCFPTTPQIYIFTQALVQRRCVMKSYDKLKAEMETIQQQMAEANKKECTIALKKVKELCKEFGSIAGMLKGSIAKGCKSK
jgi:uncharacterized membrane protein (DUF106 family)